MTILGMMSGTSMDAIDCIISEIKISSNFNLTYNVIEQNCFPIPLLIRKKIIRAIENPKLNFEELDNLIGKFHSNCALKLKNTHLLDSIAIHGQTIYHKERIKSLQIGNPKYLYENHKVPIIYNFRKHDILENGTGAPLMPYLDWLLLKNTNFSDFTLNIGGISNITSIPKNTNRNQVIGFDTGPGMALIDECCIHFWKVSFDKNGMYSEKGKINEKLLNHLMDHPFINKNFPKSTGRDIFGKKMVLQIVDKYQHESPENILRTFIAFTAKSISTNLNKILNFTPLYSRLFISGGGIHHPILIDDLKKYSQIQYINNSKVLGIHTDYKEALLIAILGYSKLNQMKSNMPSVTGANCEVVLGEIYTRN
ncbi:MAG: hypothetical protein CMF96_06635 [Candidatus Marinimicrobia bacterium]|nr:hypothetical protein [Candidatus Neomarinimicrobiota bacterium]